MSEPFKKLSLANTKVRELEDRIAELEGDRQAAREDAEYAQADLALLRSLDASKFAVAMHERAEQAEAERDKWEWVARDACRELAYETHVNPESPLDYRLAHLPRPPSPPD